MPGSFRQALRLILVGCLLTAGLVAQAEKTGDKPLIKGRDILKQALDKCGGMKALKGISDYEIEMTGTQSMDSGETTKFRSTTKVRFGKSPSLLLDLRIRFGDQEWVERLTLKGDRGYQQNRIGGRRLSQNEVAQNWARYHRTTIGILRGLLDSNVKVEYIGADRVRDKSTEVIRILRPGEPPLRVDVDPITGFFPRVQWKERPPSGRPPIRRELRNGEFETLGQLQGLPLMAELREAGKVVMTRKVLSRKANLGLKDEEFKVE